MIGYHVIAQRRTQALRNACTFPNLTHFADPAWKLTPPASFLKTVPAIDQAQLDAALQDSLCGFAIVAAPLKERFSWTKKCLEAGKHVLVETPLSFKRTELQELSELAKTRDRNLQLGWYQRWDEDCRVTRDLILKNPTRFKEIQWILKEPRFKHEAGLNALALNTRPVKFLKEFVIHELDEIMFLFGPVVDFQVHSLELNEVGFRVKFEIISENRSHNVSFFYNANHASDTYVQKMRFAPGEGFRSEADSWVTVPWYDRYLEAVKKETEVFLEDSIRTELSKVDSNTIAERTYEMETNLVVPEILKDIMSFTSTTYLTGTIPHPEIPAVV